MDRWISDDVLDAIFARVDEEEAEADAAEPHYHLDTHLSEYEPPEPADMSAPAGAR